MPRAKSSSSRTSPSGHGSTSISRSPSPSSGIVRKRRHNFKLAVELRDYFEEPYGEFLDTLLSNPLLSASPNRYKIELHKRTAEQIAPRGFGWVLWISTETRQEFLAQKDRFCPNRTHSEFVVFLLLLSGNWKVPSAEMSESEEEAHSRSLTPSSASPASPAGSTPQLRPSSEIKQENLEECDSAATSSSDIDAFAPVKEESPKDVQSESRLSDDEKLRKIAADLGIDLSEVQAQATPLAQPVGSFALLNQEWVDKSLSNDPRILQDIFGSWPDSSLDVAAIECLSTPAIGTSGSMSRHSSFSQTKEEADGTRNYVSPHHPSSPAAASPPRFQVPLNDMLHFTPYDALLAQKRNFSLATMDWLQGIASEFPVELEDGGLEGGLEDDNDDDDASTVCYDAQLSDAPTGWTESSGRRRPSYSYVSAKSADSNIAQPPTFPVILSSESTTRPSIAVSPSVSSIYSASLFSSPQVPTPVPSFSDLPFACQPVSESDFPLSDLLNSFSTSSISAESGLVLFPPTPPTPICNNSHLSGTSLQHPLFAVAAESDSAPAASQGEMTDDGLISAKDWSAWMEMRGNSEFKPQRTPDWDVATSSSPLNTLQAHRQQPLNHTGGSNSGRLSRRSSLQPYHLSSSLVAQRRESNAALHGPFPARPS